MSSDQQCSSDVPQMNSTRNVSSEKHTPSEEVKFRRDERVSFDITPFDNQPFVTIEYDDDNQPDPLAVDDTVITPLVSRYHTNRKIRIYHPFSQQADEYSEPSLPRSPESFYQWSPSKVTPCGGKSFLRDSDQEEVIVLSDDDASDVNLGPELGRKAIHSVQSQTEFSDKSVRDIEDRNVQNGSSLVDLIDDVMHGDDDTSQYILTKKIAEQMLIKIEERKLAAIHLKQKTQAVTAFARQLAQQIMKPGSQLPQDSAVSIYCVAPMTRKQLKAAENALARRIVKELSKGCSLEEATVAFRSITSSFRPTPVNSMNGANRGEASAKLLAGAPDGRTLQEQLDRLAPQPQQMEAPPHNTSMGAKRLDQSMPKEDHHNIRTPWPEASPSKASSLQQALPSYAVAFRRPNC